MVDWVARQRNANPQITREEFKTILKTTQDQFRNQCPELAVCEQICNGAKHLVLDNPQLQPFDVAADVRGTSDLAGISKMDVFPGDKNVDIVLTPAVSIIDKGGNSC
jgi:hypothetical protein